MSKSLGTGIDPLDVIDAHGADATRYGLLKISSTQDVRFSEGAIEEGRKLANKLWNVARLVLSHAEGAPRAAAARSRGALDPRPHRRGPRRGGAALGGVRVLAGSAGALPPHLRRLLRLVRRGDQAAAARGRPRRRRDRARRARAPARAAPPGDAARDGGDLVEPPGPQRAPDRLAVARARRPLRRRRRRARARAGGGRDLPPQRRPRRPRRRRPPDLRRGRPSRPGEGERQRGRRARPAPQRDRARREDARERPLRRQRARGGRRGGAREARALPARARRALAETAGATATAWVAALSPWPEEFGLDRMHALLARSATRSAASGPSTSSARTGSPRRRGRSRQLLADGLRTARTSRRTCAAGASGSGSTATRPTSSARSPGCGRRPWRSGRRSSRC